MLQAKNIRLIGFVFRFKAGLFGKRFLESAQFCLHKLAFLHHFSLFLRIEISCFPSGITFCLRLLYLFLIGSDGMLPLFLQLQDETFGFLHVGVGFQFPDALVNAGYFSLVDLEISVGLQIVENGRHKVVPVASSTYLSAIGGKITYFWGT